MEENYTLYEQETSITYNKEESFATIYTANPVDVRKLDKIFSERGEEMKLEAQTGKTRTYQVPKKWIKIRPNMIISEERRKELSERAKQSMLNLRKNTGKIPTN